MSSGVGKVWLHGAGRGGGAPGEVNVRNKKICVSFRTGTRFTDRRLYSGYFIRSGNHFGNK
jgi:hypothetical protein